MPLQQRQGSALPLGTLLSWCCPHHFLQPCFKRGHRCGGTSASQSRGRARRGQVGGWAGTVPHGWALGQPWHCPLTDGEQLLLSLAGCGLQTLQKPPGDVQNVISVREESFQVELGQLKGTKMPQAEPNGSEMEQVF